MRDTEVSWLEIGDVVRILGRSISGGDTHLLEGPIIDFDSGGNPVAELKVNANPGRWSVREEQCVLIEKKNKS